MSLSENYKTIYCSDWNSELTFQLSSPWQAAVAAKSNTFKVHSNIDICKFSGTLEIPCFVIIIRKKIKVLGKISTAFKVKCYIKMVLLMF